MKRHSNSKHADKTAKATVQLDFLPTQPVYPPELRDATEAVVRVGETSWLRIERLVNQPDPALNRYTKEEWRRQVDSYRTLGIKSAVHVRPVEGGDLNLKLIQRHRVWIQPVDCRGKGMLSYG